MVRSVHSPYNHIYENLVIESRFELLPKAKGVQYVKRGAGPAVGSAQGVGSQHHRRTEQVPKEAHLMGAHERHMNAEIGSWWNPFSAIVDVVKTVFHVAVKIAKVVAEVVKTVAKVVEAVVTGDYEKHTSISLGTISWNYDKTTGHAVEAHAASFFSSSEVL